MQDLIDHLLISVVDAPLKGPKDTDEVLVQPHCPETSAQQDVYRLAQRTPQADHAVPGHRNRPSYLARNWRNVVSRLNIGLLHPILAHAYKCGEASDILRLRQALHALALRKRISLWTPRRVGTYTRSSFSTTFSCFSLPGRGGNFGMATFPPWP